MRHRAGHCEYFASATALMLASRGVRARLVTGSYGGEVGLFSSAMVVRGGNLHAWVEADLDGTGFAVLDPTPPAGLPPEESRGSFWRQLTSLGRELEFFYDRRILGFESLDQQQFFETARERVQGIAGAASSGWRGVVDAPAARLVFGIAVGLAAAGILMREILRRAAPPRPGHEGVRRCAGSPRAPRGVRLAGDAARRGGAPARDSAAGRSG